MSVDQIVQLIQSAIQFGTVILFGAMGEIPVSYTHLTLPTMCQV